MIKLSAGTAHVLGLKRLKTDAPPTTAYLMAGEGCVNNCSFCSQAVSNRANKDDLSRIRWKEYSQQKILDALSSAAKEEELYRVCVQVVENRLTEKELPDFLDRLIDQVELPVCVSKSIDSLAEIEDLISRGVDRVNISLDAVNPDRHSKIKGGSYQEKYNFLVRAAREFPGRISTHIIIGLGESEREVVELLADLKKLNAGVGIFAFTPLPGTELTDYPRPDIGKYRRIQIANYLIYNHGFRMDDFNFTKGRLSGIDRPTDELLDLLAGGEVFETVGCPDCNRPYYNEKPGGTIYNYPRSLEPEEVKKAIKESRLVNSDE